MLGFLPVIPGPCGLFRMSAIRQKAIPYYLSTVHKNPDQIGMVMGSLLLAEDRILSLAAVLLSEKGAYTAYEPAATFYFEAETNPKQLCQQRRRWTNGTVVSC